MLFIATIICSADSFLLLKKKLLLGKAVGGLLFGGLLGLKLKKGASFGHSGYSGYSGYSGHSGNFGGYRHPGYISYH